MMRIMALTPVLGAALVLFLAPPASAQFSTEIPGIPRASVPMFSGSQGRFELDVSGFSLSNDSGDTKAGRVRMGMGKSWRAGSNWEFGFDLTAAEGQWLDASDAAGGEQTDETSSVWRATALYGLRLGLKFRPISFVSPDGNGFQAAIGVAYQPELQTVYAIESKGDSSVTGGYIGESGDEGEQSEASGLPDQVYASTQVLIAASYRRGRLTADGGFLIESGSDGGDTPLTVYDGVTPRLGVKYRLTHGFGLGFAWWGSGAPPWRDRISLGTGVEEEDQSFGIVLSFGGTPEKSTDLMISSPGGSFSESVGIFLQVK